MLKKTIYSYLYTNTNSLILILIPLTLLIIKIFILLLITNSSIDINYKNNMSIILSNTQISSFIKNSSVKGVWLIVRISELLENSQAVCNGLYIASKKFN